MDISALFLYLFTTSITPGPNNLMCLYLGAKGGLRGTRRFLIGSVGSVFIKALLCGLLNVLLASFVPRLIPWLKWLGAFYMLWLAFSMIRSAGSEQITAENSGESTVRAGILLQCLNMKSWIAAISVFSVYVIPHTTSVRAIALTALLMTGLIALASLCWTLFGKAVQRLYRQYRLPLSIVMAASLVFCAYTAVR